MSLKVSQAKAAMGILNRSNAFTGPVRAVFRLTNRCNIRCIHCYLYSDAVNVPNYRIVKNARNQKKDLPSNEMIKSLNQLNADSDTISKKIEELIGMGTPIYQFSGGEPFLHKDILKLTSKIKAAGGYCTANTNGTLLTPDILKELIDLRFDGLRITTMAGDASMYVTTHPGTRTEMFETLENNLLYLKERKESLKIKKPKVTLVFVLIKQNAEEILNFARFAVKVKADKVEYRPINYHSDNGLAFFTPEEKQIIFIKTQLAEAKTMLEFNGVEHDIDKFHKVFSLYRDTSALYNHIPCYLGWISLHIETDGGVYPCCAAMVPFGNISERSIRKIWHGDKYREFRKEAISINKRKTPVNNCDCNHCGNFSANLNLYRIFHPIKSRYHIFRELEQDKRTLLIEQ